MQLDDLIGIIVERSAAACHPIVVGISGYGGSGKSTLARELVDRLGSSAVRMRGDDFLDPVRSHTASQEWDGVERERLIAEVLRPFREGEPSTFRRFDWSARALSLPEPLPNAEVMIVDLVGLFHPLSLPYLDLTIWCDVDLQTATARGMRRDAALGRDHSRLWAEAWEPNEREFESRFQPRESADILYATA